MSFVEVFPTEPVIATTRALLFARTALPIAASAAKSSSGTSVAAAPRARASSRIRLAAADGDEEVAGRDAARVDLDAGHLARRRPRAGRGPRSSASRERDQVRAPRVRSASRAASRSSNGIVRSANSCPCSAPLPAIRTTSPSRAELDRARDRGRAVRLDLDVADRAGDDRVDDRLRILAARIVVRDDHDVGELGGDAPHLRPLLAVAVAAAAEDAEHAPGRELARRAQQRLERDRLVRVVDDHRRTAALRRSSRIVPARRAPTRGRARSRRRRCRAAAPRRARRARSRR